jgi:hypothetical protein
MNSNAQMLGFALISAAGANAQPSQLRGLPSESNPDPAWDCGSVLAGEFRIGPEKFEGFRRGAIGHRQRVDYEGTPGGARWLRSF